jgi:hypothetical protein
MTLNLSFENTEIDKCYGRKDISLFFESHVNNVMSADVTIITLLNGIETQ